MRKQQVSKVANPGTRNYVASLRGKEKYLCNELIKAINLLKFNASTNSLEIESSLLNIDISFYVA